MTPQSVERDPRYIIASASRSLGLLLDEEQLDAMMVHLELLIRWRKRAGLTSMNDPAKMALLHFVDSITVLKVMDIGERPDVLDVGAGAGFPGVVIRVVDTSVRLTLLDRNPKKIVFLKMLCNRMGIGHVHFKNMNFSELLEDSSQAFDLIVSRAFSSNQRVLDSFAALLRPGGSMIRMGGPSLDQASAKLSNFREMCRWEGNLPGSSVRRKVIRYAVI